MTSTIRARLAALASPLALALAACADDPGAAPADAGPADAGPCGFASDRYLPFAPGHRWTYLVTDLESGERKVKDQALEAGADGRVVQRTGKLAGSTRSVLTVDGDRVVRLQQVDLDTSGVVERTTRYAPGQIRIDESAARLAPGASWEEVYDETIVDAGEPAVVVRNRDRWEVLAIDAACAAPAGSFTCVHLRRTRLEGGVAVKEFWFARGVGKVRERGDNVVEELQRCGG